MKSNFNFFASQYEIFYNLKIGGFLSQNLKRKSMQLLRKYINFFGKLLKNTVNR